MYHPPESWILEAGIAKHCLGAKIVDLHVCNFNSEICYATKVPLQVARAPHPTLETPSKHTRERL